ncbi:ParB/RepB/Spo0J family partition protein [Nocardiopsis ganjiahuensis]|uniref:ParB/RepB/Spo0J family partition protein n=1 Tax=Nocardiopsis ganjiahuensis TaxID=239984 RepID=UPI00034B5159|nr:ParB/RepB/Spo0J family partition protein [Nocardiopsis ganjiahuensis]
MSKADKLGRSASFGAAGRATSARRQLISQAAGEAPADPARVPLEQLVGNPENPRESLGELDELAHSLKEHGLLQPLHVIPRHAYLQVHPEHEAAVGEAVFVVVNGNRRLTAARQARLETVAVHVRTPRGEEDESEIALRAAVLAENIHRQDLHPLEEAREINKLLGHGLNRSQAAALLGKSNGWITQRLILLDLHPDLQQALKGGALKLAQARELGKLPLEEQLPAHREQQEEFYRVKPERSAPQDGPSPESVPPQKPSPAPQKSEPTGKKRASSRPEQLTLDLSWDEPEVLADQVYKELASGLGPKELQRFAHAFLKHL